MDRSKFSHLIQAGQIINTVDGKALRIVSKLTSGYDVRIRLADLQGKIVNDLNWRPINLPLARFASWMRWVVAYNKDFNMYINNHIQDAGLPILPTMNWSKWFEAKIAPHLISKDPEVQEEAIHHIIVKLFVDQKILSNFKASSRNFPPQWPIEQQVNSFLIQNFIKNIGEMNYYIENKGLLSKNKEVNPSDTIEYPDTFHDYEVEDTDTAIQIFRRGFKAYLSDKFLDEIVVQYLALFDLLYYHLRKGDIPNIGSSSEVNAVEEDGKPIVIAAPTLYDEWKEETNSTRSYQWFKVLFANLLKLIDIYVTNKLKDKDVDSFIQVMQNIGKDSSMQEREKDRHPAHTSSLKLAEDFPINHEIDPVTPSGNNGSGNGSLPTGDLGGLGSAAEEAGEAAGEAGKALALVANKKARGQWKLPRCKSCGCTRELADCPACHEKFCGDCMLNHHANNPSHDRILASKKTKNNVSSSKKVSSPISDEEDGRNFLDEPKSYDNTPSGQDNNTSSGQDDIADCVSSGLCEQMGEPYFSWAGCDYCGEAGNVADYKGYRNIEEAQNPNREELEFEFQLCDDCLYKLTYGEE